MQNKDRVKFVLISISVVIPMDEGKFPTEWLLCKFTSTRNGQIIQQFGISPDKWQSAQTQTHTGNYSHKGRITMQ